jgi:hypothetical protein
MEILHIEKEGPKLNTLERFHICDITKKGIQMNNIFTDIYNLIFDILIKTYIYKKNLPLLNNCPPHSTQSYTGHTHTCMHAHMHTYPLTNSSYRTAPA